MADIDRIIQVTISRDTVVPTMASFNYPLIASEFLMADVTPTMTERVRVYTSLAAMVAAGFTASTVVGRAAAAMFAQGNLPRVYVGRKKTGADGTETWDVALAAMLLEQPAWYGLVVGNRTKADQQTIATWVEANGRLCMLASADTDIPGDDTSPADIAQWLHDQAMDRTGVIYHPEADLDSGDPHPDAAWMAFMFGKDPGSATWAYKTLSGIAVYVLTGGQIVTALAKNANIYTAISGVNLTQMGQVGSGEYLDIIHGLDWLKARIQQKIFTPIAQQDKVPFTDAGIEMITNQLKSALQDAKDIALIESYETSAPLAADVDSADKALRLLPDVRFTAILAGAVHKVEVAGVVRL
jgi:hypothetical protein